MVKHLQAKHRDWFLLRIGSSGRSEAVRSMLAHEPAVGWSVLRLKRLHHFSLLHFKKLHFFFLFLIYYILKITPVKLLVILTLLFTCFSSLVPPPSLVLVFVKGAQAHPPPLWPFVTSFSDSSIQREFAWLELLVCLKVHTFTRAES